MENRRLREYLKEVNTYYQELISFKRRIKEKKADTKQIWRDEAEDIGFNSAESRIGKKGWRLRSWVERTRRKLQALEGISLLAEATKYL